MNIKINSKEFDFLKPNIEESFVIGSRMYRTNTEVSDTDILHIHEGFELGSFKHLPNIHQFQYDEEETNTQHIITSYEQFWKNQSSGDSIINSEVIMFTNFVAPSDRLNYVYTYKVIKAFLGFAKRDIKNKKVFHAYRCISIAESLILGKLPILEELIKAFKISSFKSDKELLFELALKVETLRMLLNQMMDYGLIKDYYVPKIFNNVFQKLLSSNNTREFKYEKTNLD